MLCGLGALPAKIDVPVIDPSEVNFMKSAFVGHQNRSFRCDLCVGQLDERVIRVPDFSGYFAEVLPMLANDGRGVRWIGANDPKCHVLRLELRLQTPDLRDITIGDRTVCCDKL